MQVSLRVKLTIHKNVISWLDAEGRLLNVCISQIIVTHTIPYVTCRTAIFYQIPSEKAIDIIPLSIEQDHNFFIIKVFFLFVFFFALLSCCHSYQKSTFSGRLQSVYWESNLINRRPPTAPTIFHFWVVRYYVLSLLSLNVKLDICVMTWAIHEGRGATLRKC